VNRLSRLFGGAASAGGQAARVGRASFRFFGFRNRPEDVLFSRFDYIADALPPLLELEGAIFRPEQRCLYDPDGVRIDETKVTFTEPGAPSFFNEEKFRPIEERTMPDRIDPPAGALRVREPVLFLGEIHDHWGHFITDSMSRMWALDQLPRTMKVLFAPDPKARIDTPLVRELMGALELDGRLLRPEGPVIFDKVLCPIGALQLSRVYEGFGRVHRRAAAVLARSAGEIPSGPVYLTRRRLGADLRRLADEEVLEGLLEREGFRILSPERMSLADQMALFNSRYPVVGAFGSAMHTVLFRQTDEPQPVATLFPGKIPPRFMMVDAVKAAQAAYIRCIRFEGEPGAGGGGWRIQPRAAMQWLDAAGLIGQARR
jgi:hypothetical protein